MSNKPVPNSDKFKQYRESKDKSGFTIPGSDFVYKYDSHGGWYDEHKFYYNSKGVYTPEGPTKGAKENTLEANRNYDDENWEEEEDDLLKDYVDDDDDDDFNDDDYNDDDYDEKLDEIYAKDELVISNLRKDLTANSNNSIQIDFAVRGTDATESDIIDFFKDKLPPAYKLNVNFKDPSKIFGNFVVEGIEVAIECFKKSGKELKSGKIYIAIGKHMFDYEKSAWEIESGNEYCVEFSNFNFQCQEKELQEALKKNGIMFKSTKLNRRADNKLDGTGSVIFHDSAAAEKFKQGKIQFKDRVLKISSKTQTIKKAIQEPPKTHAPSQNITPTEQKPLHQVASTQPAKPDQKNSSNPQPQNNTVFEGEVQSKQNSNALPKSSQPQPGVEKKEIPKNTASGEEANKANAIKSVAEVEKEQYSHLGADKATEENKKDTISNASKVLDEWDIPIAKKKAKPAPKK